MSLDSWCPTEVDENSQQRNVWCKIMYSQVWSYLRAYLNLVRYQIASLFSLPRMKPGTDTRWQLGVLATFLVFSFLLSLGCPMATSTHKPDVEHKGSSFWLEAGDAGWVRKKGGSKHCTCQGGFSSSRGNGRIRAGLWSGSYFHCEDECGGRNNFSGILKDW